MQSININKYKHQKQAYEVLERIQLNYKAITKPIENIILLHDEQNKIRTIKIIHNDKILTLDYTVECCETSWFEIPSDAIIQQNNLISDGYIQFSDLVGKKIKGINFLCEIQMQYCDQNKIYKILLANNKYSYILLRTKSNGYYTPILKVSLHSKVIF